MRDFSVLFLRRGHSTEQAPFSRVSLPGIHFTAESTETTWIKFLAQEDNILMQSGLNRQPLYPETDILAT